MLAIGAELLAGETRDTNSGEIAGNLTGLGVEVRRMTQLPDDRSVITAAVSSALERVDLVVTSGGLGPTPDDLTREGIADALGQEPRVDPEIEAWLRGLWAKRDLPFSDVNLKQAWLLPSASALANPHGTAPGWWVERGDQVVIALPGPPRELRPMWHDEALPRLQGRGLGVDRAARTLRLTGIGESTVVDLIGKELLEHANPRMATYARADSVDVRVSATGDATTSADQLVREAVDSLSPRIDAYVFAHDDETWPEALGRRLGSRQLATAESGTGGYVGHLLGSAPFLCHAENDREVAADAASLAEQVRTRSGAEVGLAAVAHESGDDMRVDVAVDTSTRRWQATHSVFRGGDAGRRRAANAAVAELWRGLTEEG
jgi:nicotinamide-nucleotide amidase